MNRSGLLLFLSLTMIAGVSATSGGPDYFGYEFKDSYEPGGPVYNWIEINTTGTSILSNSNDGTRPSVPLGFTFKFYGTDYNSITISSNGLAGFGSGLSASYNQPIGVGNPHNFIAPFWDDLSTENSYGGGEIYYKTSGIAPKRQFIIEWYNVKARYRRSSSFSTATFETIINETGEIIFQYRDVDFGNADSNNGASATAGIESSTGQGLQYSYNSAVLNNGLVILFSGSIPPGSINDLRNITYAQNYINWTWVDPIDADFSKVSIYINGIHQTDVLKGIQFYNTTANFASLAPDTNYEIATRTIDTSGNMNLTWVNATNRTAPIPASLSITINSGAIYTNSTSVLLDLTAINAQHMSFKNDSDMPWSPWETFDTSRSWTLTSGNGLKTVYFRTRYGTGEAMPVNDTIILDSTTPITTIILTGDQRTTGWYASSVNIVFTAVDDTSDVAQTEYNLDNFGWTTYTGQFNINKEGTTVVQYRSIDNAGNIEPVNSLDVRIDTIPPESVTNLTNVTFEKNYINWTWTDPSDLDLSHIMVYIDGSFQKNVTTGEQSFNSPYFLPDTSHTIGTHTVDLNGNINENWVTNTSRTAPVILNCDNFCFQINYIIN